MCNENCCTDVNYRLSVMHDKIATVCVRCMEMTKPCEFCEPQFSNNVSVTQSICVNLRPKAVFRFLGVILKGRNNNMLKTIKQSLANW